MASAQRPDALHDYIRRNERWNVAANALDSAFYQFALTFVYGSTVLTMYARHLTDSAVLIGLLPALQNAMYFIPQLLLAEKFRQLPSQKPYVLRISMLQRFPYLLVALAILLWPNAPRPLAYTILALGVGSAVFGCGLAAPGWNAIIAKLIRAERRGILLGISQGITGLLGVGGALVVSHVLSAYPYPYGFGICFALAFVCQVMSWIAFGQVREPAVTPPARPQAREPYLQRLVGILRQNCGFRRYLLGRGLLVVGSMASSFYIVYARDVFGALDAFAGEVTVVALLSQTIGTPLLGLISDRRGNKFLLELGALFAALAVVLALLASTITWLYGVFVCMYLATSCMLVGGVNLTMEFSLGDDVPTFTALANTLFAVPILLAPILGGLLVDLGGYVTLFYIAGGFLVLGWATLHWLVRDPRFTHGAGAHTPTQKPEVA
ncbi:MAG: MFS transporter [Anaerolineae bacterium]